ncbi:MAG TPA: nucleotide exchange factor GrpE [Chthoniobacterales bacterium]
MSEAIEVDADFGTAMHELSAEAVTPPSRRKEPEPSATTALIGAVYSLNQRMEALEESMLRKFESIHFEKIEEQLAVIRDSETVNQKLFDSLHQELISYRDNFVRDALQKPFIRDLLMLFDDLSALADQMGSTAEKESSDGAQTRSLDNLTNVLHFVVEILHRLEVTEIEVKERVDRTLHRVISFEPAESAEEDGLIVKRLKRGFIWQDRTLRAEEVIAKRFQ